MTFWYNQNMIGIYDLGDFLDYKTRLQIYKNAGFQEVALYIDKNYVQQTEDYCDIISYARKIGLKINQAHIDYKISNMICDESSSAYFDYVEEKLKECEKLNIKYMVLHASKGDNPPLLTQVQLSKLEKIAQKHKSIFLCFENVRDNKNLDIILTSKEPNIKMCFDLGHAHAYANEYLLFDKYKDKIVCSHIHNNFGQDTHFSLDKGEIDCNYFLENLNKISYSNCLECFPNRGEEINEEKFVLFVKNCFKNIEKYN